MFSALFIPLLTLGLAAPVPVASAVGLHVPWAVGGSHYDADGRPTDEPEQWPDFVVPTVRLWDTRTTWADLEPRDDDWRFSHLDAHVAVAEAHGTHDLLMVLAGTPAWAARDPDASGAPWLPRGSASPPRQLEEWREFVRTVAARYVGRIDAYQIGNEPNLRWFWQGSRWDLSHLVRMAAEEIHGVDPQARVVAPGPLVTTVASAARAARWWRALSGTGVDVLALQWYPPRGTRPRALAHILDRMRHATENTTLHGLPIWLTEVNHMGNEREARALVTGTMRVARQVGLERTYWYAWTALARPALLDFGRGSPAATALKDYAVTSRAR